MSQFWENLRTDRRTDGRTDGRTDPILRILPVEAGGPKKRLAQVYSCGFCEIFKSNFYYTTHLVAGSVFSIIYKSTVFDFTEMERCIVALGARAIKQKETATKFHKIHKKTYRVL